MIAWSSLRRYSDLLTADLNRKGVLDVDTVKGCSAGIGAHSPYGCYDGCYAAKVARFRGLNFARAVVRRVKGSAHARKIEAAVRAAPDGLFRIGTMGDPSHAWEHTVLTVEWLAPFAVPVIVTKHWYSLTDDQIARLVRAGAVMNTSISALDSDDELAHRETEIARYREAGGVSIARVVSCDFTDDRRRKLQARLMAYPYAIDNPLRVPTSHPLVVGGDIRITRTMDLNTVRTMSLADPARAYVGKCSTCPDKCGLVACHPDHPRPQHPQLRIDL